MNTIFDIVSAQSPHSPAIGAPDRDPLLFGELMELARQTVDGLNSIGIGRGDRMAIVLPNGPEMATTFLTIAMGASAAPLNPAYTKTNLAII